MFPFSLLGFPYNILAMIAVAVALVAGCYFGWGHFVADPYREDGRQEVRAEWEAAKAAQKVREERAAKEADNFQRRADAKREADFKRQLAGRTAELLARLSDQSISGDVVGELRNTVRTANNESPGKSEKGAPTVAGSTDGRALTEWFATVGQQYRECRETVIAWIKWDDERIVQ